MELGDLEDGVDPQDPDAADAENGQQHGNEGCPQAPEDTGDHILDGKEAVGQHRDIHPGNADGNSLLRVGDIQRQQLRRRKLPQDAELLKLLWERRDKTGIIYCATRKDVESVCQLLRSRDIGATRYHAGLAERERQENQEDFIYDRANVMVATNAFGMGIDKSNVSYVIHYSMPQSLEAYYQEAGRAGRDGAGAECILFYAPRDVYTAKWLVEHSSGESELTEEQEQKRIRQDLNRLDRMVDYCKTGLCLRGRILDYFGQEHPPRCGNCGNCDEKSRREETPTVAVPKKQKQRPTPAGLLDALKALRWDIAKKTGQPAYIIFTNASLEDMARKAPGTQEEFLKVNGVGSSKAQRYGQAFLECIREYTASHRED